MIVSDNPSYTGFWLKKLREWLVPFSKVRETREGTDVGTGQRCKMETEGSATHTHARACMCTRITHTHTHP